MYAKDEKGLYTLVDRREMLKIKIKSLAAEARIIRKEEKKTFGTLRNELHDHRVKDVRWVARHAHIAYGLIRGRAYERMEQKAKHEPNWKEVERLCKKYGPKGFNGPYKGGDA